MKRIHIIMNGNYVFIANTKKKRKKERKRDPMATRAL